MENPDQFDEQQYKEKVAYLKSRKVLYEKQLNNYQIKWWALLLCTAFGGAIGYIAYLNTGWSGDKAFTYIFIGATVGGSYYAIIMIFLSSLARSSLRRVESDLIHYGAFELQGSIEENFFTKLIQINFKYIDQYYLQTQGQADKSFKLACVASAIGFAIICTGIVMMFLSITQPAYVTTAAGVISEFVSAIFFYLYNRTILKMSQYHQKLVLTQNISLALKISEDMKGETKSKVQELLVDRLTSDINKYLVNNDSK